MYCSIDKQSYSVNLTHNRWTCEMKSYVQLKVAMVVIQRQMVEAKKNERAKAL